MTDQTLATLKDREKEIGPVREDSRELLSLWAIYFEAEEGKKGDGKRWCRGGVGDVEEDS